MIKGRSWLGTLGIPLGLAVGILITADRSHPVVAGGVADPTCSSASACFQSTNNLSGPGIQTLSKGGNGLVGNTSHNSMSSTTGRNGVLGSDISTAGKFDSGVFGLSIRGTGVTGKSTSGPGVSGTSSSGVGVTASSTSGTAFAASVSGTGAVISATTISSGNAINAIAGTGSGLHVHNFGTSASDADFTTGSIGGEASIGSSNGEGLQATGFASSSSTVPALNATCVSGAPAMTASSALSSSDIMSLDCSGNMIISGLLTTSGTPLSVRRTTAGTQVATVAPQQTTQTMEDFGEAQLIGGRAYVRLAPDFAATIDRRSNYLVFITPQGDSRGLYVTMKTATGFEVRENSNGTTSLAFDYRIVAKPFGEVSRRLPAMLGRMRIDASVARLIQQAMRAKTQAQ